MKVLIATIGHFHERPGGASRIALDEAAALQRRGEDVWVMAYGSPSLPEYEVRDRIHLLRYVPESVAPWNPSRAGAHQRSATAVLKRHLPKVDVIHGHVPLVALAALDFYGSSVHSSYTIHSPARMEMAIVWKNSSFWRRAMAPLGLSMINRIEEECLRRSNATTALSQFTIDCVARIHGNELAQKLRLIPGWVDTSRFVPVENRQRVKAQLGWPTDIPVLFTLRRLESRMGLDRLLDACHFLLRDGLKFHLVIGGDGPLRGKLEGQVKAHGLSGAVTFQGQIEDRVLPLAYAACDAFVLPTAELECFGIIALEALSAGRPVLATPVGAIPEIIRAFDSTWMSRSAEAVDIANLLRQFLEGKLREHTPMELHEQIRQNYNQERVLGEFIEAILGEVVGR